MPTLSKKSSQDISVELFFTKAEMAVICKAASAKSKMRLQWILDAVADAIKREQAEECEHGIERGAYCPECNFAARRDLEGET